MSKRVAFVTGGSRGIGFGIAKQLASSGFNIIINGMREEDQISEPLHSLRGLGAKVLYCRGDIGCPEARESMLAKIKKEFGCLHVLVNNAGVAPKQRKDVLETEEEGYDFVLNTNLKGAFFLTQAASKWMIEQREKDEDYQACIVNVSSISATVVSTNRAEYCIAKAGLSMVTQLFATRLGEAGIPVYEIRPGVTKTDMTAGVTDKYDQLIADGLCVTPRWGYPIDVGKAVASLANQNFPYSTGQVIMVDGGLTIPRL